MRRWIPNLASTKLWVRAGAAAGLVLLILAWTGILAALADIPSGYGAAQSRDEAWLKAHPSDWARFRLGTSRDLFRYIPGYFIFGVVLLASVAIARRATTDRRDRMVTLVVGALLLVGAVADVIETLLFRHSLNRLLATAGAAHISTVTSVTAAMTATKFVGLAGFVVALVGYVLMPAPPGERH